MKRLPIVLVLLALAAPATARQFVADIEDFQCLLDGTKAPGKHFFVFHRKQRALKKALHKIETGKMGKGLPVGTILQLVPFEAMVKRGGKFNREGHGWEYFSLNVKADGTTEILARGQSEVLGAFTHSSCQTCHENLAAQHDAICEFVQGTEGIGLTDDILAVLQNGDPRCSK
jgi:hypothetical protein